MTTGFFLFLSGALTAQFVEPSGNASARFHSIAEGPFPNIDLPSRVRADEGKLTIFVDYDHPAKASFPIYFVNRTRRAVKFAAFGETDPMKLEVKDEKTGAWRRAQAAFWLRMCASVGPPPVVLPGMHFRGHGYRPESGVKGIVRYRNLDWNLTSNEGPGLWTEEDIAAAAVDGLSFSEAPLVSSLKLSETPGIPLGDITSDEMEQNLATLELLRMWDDSYLFHHVARAAKRDLKARSTLGPGFAAKALERIDEITATRTEPATPSSARFYEGCLAAIRSGDRSRFGTPAKFPSVAWQGIAWVADNDQLTPDQWGECYTTIRQRLPDAGRQEQQAMASLVANTAAQDYLDKDFLIQGAGKAYPGIQDSCLRQLANRELWPELMDLAEKEDTPGKLRILGHICVDRRSEYPNRRWLQTYDGSIIKLWTDCIHEDWGGTLETMYRGVDAPDKLSFETWQSLAFQKSAEEFLAKAEKNPWPMTAPDLLHLSQFLATYSKGRSPQDPVLSAFAAVGTTRPQGETDEQNRRRNQVALTAKRLLKIAEAERME